MNTVKLKTTAKKFTTNEEFITHLMNFSRNGVMIQPYIMEALRIYSEQVIAMSPKDREQMDKGFITYQTWEACAKETLEALEQQHG